jgi:Tol biopolymer transport system component
VVPSMPVPFQQAAYGDAVRSEVSRILSSPDFRRSERLRRFLTYVVEETLVGRGDELKEYAIALAVFDRPDSYDPDVDSIVRVEARKLRFRLDQYYETVGFTAAVRIKISKGSYFPTIELREVPAHMNEPVLIAVPAVPEGARVPIFEGSHESPLPMPAAKTSAAESHGAVRRFRSWRIAGATTIVAAAMGTTAWLVVPKVQPISPRLIPLTSDPGDERQPSLSPDGNFIAFQCSEPGQPDFADICVKAVGAEVTQRLTETPVAESWPAWSPDGREIVFGRTLSGTAPAFQDFDRELGISVVSRLGGPERKVSPTGAFAGWTPDGKSILILDHLKSGEPRGIFQVDLESLRRRRLTLPPMGENDWRFEVSPNGKTLAFIRLGPQRLGDLYVVPMERGEPRRVTDWQKYLTGVAWTPDSKELVYSVDRRLWRISARLDRPGHGSLIPDIPMQAIGLSISRPGPGRLARLAFRTGIDRVSLRRIDLTSAVTGGMMQGVLPFAPATRTDIPGRFSPDGSRVAFVSNRSSANLELWVADNDGGRPRQITALDSAVRVHAGSWSSDGKRLLFDAAINGNHDVYVISAEGGKPVRLTTASSIDWVAEWSKDGRWVYYSSATSTTISNIWRIPADGGLAEQITSQGGFEPQESSNGQYLYYLDRPPLTGSARLMRIPAGGGDAKMLVDGVTPFLW